MPQRKLVIALFVLALIGLADSAFLTFQKLSAGTVPCIVGKSCEIVTSSQYAMIGPIPLAAFGMAYYLSVLIVAGVVLETRSARWFQLLLGLTVIGSLVSLVLVYLQLFVIQAICIYCMISAGTSLGLLTLALVGWKSRSSLPVG